MRSFKKISREEIFKVKQENILVDASYLKCEVCEEEILLPGNEDENFTKAYDIYRQMKNLLLPNEIKEIREKYGLSQRMLAKILGWGHATLSRYETGALQSVSHNNELVLIDEPANMLKLLEVNKVNILNEEYEKVKERIKEIVRSREAVPDSALVNDKYSHFIDEAKSNKFILHFEKAIQKELNDTVRHEYIKKRFSETELIPDDMLIKYESSKIRVNNDGFYFNSDELSSTMAAF